MFDKCVKEVLQVLLRFACCLICEGWRNASTLLECSAEKAWTLACEDHAESILTL